jgi:cell wall-associated NlpC family hydrolase
MVTRAQVVECARSYIGTPWHHQARVKGPKGGIDCAGLIICIAEELGLVEKSVETPNYSRYPDGTLLPTCAKYMHSILSHTARPGDVLLFTFTTDPEHLGIVAEIDGRRTVIHSYAQARGVVENDLDELWLSRIRGAYRLPGIE